MSHTIGGIRNGNTGRNLEWAVAGTAAGNDRYVRSFTAYAAAVCGAGMPTEAGTLYPLLRRLEKQGLLTSEWETEGAKPRKYYAVTPAGREVYGRLRIQWQEMTEAIGRILDGGKEK